MDKLAIFDKAISYTCDHFWCFSETADITDLYTMDWQLPSNATELLWTLTKYQITSEMIIWARPPFCFTVFQSIKMTILSTVTIGQI